MADPEGEILTLEEVAAYLKAGKRTVYRPAQDGKIPAFKLGGSWRFHLADALPKLQGLAAYANEYADAYRRIEAVAEASGKLRVLDLTRADVRQAVLGASSAKSLFEGLLAADYA